MKFRLLSAKVYLCAVHYEASTIFVTWLLRTMSVSTTLSVTIYKTLYILYTLTYVDIYYLGTFTLLSCFDLIKSTSVLMCVMICHLISNMFRLHSSSWLVLEIHWWSLENSDPSI